MPTKTEPIHISVSAVRAYQQCKALYYLRYVRRLVKNTGKPYAPQLGIYLHEYLSGYYQNIKDEVGDTEICHNLALVEAHRKMKPAIASSIVAWNSIDPDAANEIGGMPEKVARIAQRYYDLHGRIDAELWEILEVEQWHYDEIDDDEELLNVSVIDMVARNRRTGVIYIWEHKSHKVIPSNRSRLINLQTFIYREVLSAHYDIGGVVWNYLRTVEPHEPKMVNVGKKNEGLSRDKQQNTTWELYLQAIRTNHLNQEDYLDMWELFGDAEEQDYFPRIPQEIVTAQQMANDYISEAKNIKRARRAWDAGVIPVRSISMMCEWCDFRDITLAALTGGDVEDVIRLGFIERARKEDEVLATKDEEAE